MTSSGTSSNLSFHVPNHGDHQLGGILSSHMDETTQKVLLGIVVFFAGLIGLVVIVGLLQQKMDPTGIATLIGGILTGLVGSILLLKQKGGGNNNEQQ